MAGADGAPAILVVEDDAGIAMMIQLALGEIGRASSVATTLSDALRIAADIRPALVLLDIRLHDVDGLAFIDAYPERDACSVVVMTASEDAAGAAARSSADGYLAKPFGIPALYAIVDRYASAPDASSDAARGDSPEPGEPAPASPPA